MKRVACWMCVLGFVLAPLTFAAQDPAKTTHEPVYMKKDGKMYVDGKPFKGDMTPLENARLANTDKGDFRPLVSVKDGQIFVGGKPATYKDGQFWVDGKPVKDVHVTMDKQSIADKRKRLVAAPAGTPRLDVAIPQEKVEKDIWLPRLYAFDIATGKEVDAKALPASLAKYLEVHRTKWKGTGTETPLAGALKDARRTDGTDAIGGIDKHRKIALVQWWAEWCFGCHEEGRDLVELFAKNDLSQVQWIAVEADPIAKEDVADKNNTGAAR